VDPTPPDPGDLGRRLALRRAELGLSREQVAGYAGMAPGYLAYLEERSAQPTAGATLRLAAALLMTPGGLVGGGVDQPAGQAGAGRHAVLVELPPDECLRQLRPGGVGRVVMSTRSGPIAVPVDFALAGRAVELRTAEDTEVARHLGERVGFEVDHLDDAMCEGWSVLVTGVAREVGGPEWSPERSPEGNGPAGVEPWAGGRRQVRVRIDPDQITGRRIRAR
jgi:hypothetical protein